MMTVEIRTGRITCLRSQASALLMKTTTTEPTRKKGPVLGRGLKQRAAAQWCGASSRQPDRVAVLPEGAALKGGWTVLASERMSTMPIALL